MHDDDPARRRFWTARMDSAYAFMDRMLAYPVAECGEPLVSLPEAAHAAGVPVVFSTTQLAGAYDRIFTLRTGLIEGFIAVAREMQGLGWTLKVEDGYRTRAMQKSLGCAPGILDAIVRKTIWENGGTSPTPDLMLRRLTALIATCPKIGTHMSGSALDISVLRSDSLTEIDRGGPYLDLSERTSMDSPFIADAAAQNRAAITRVLSRHGFAAYPYEFWHYSRGDAYAEHLAGSGQPARYGPVDCDPATGAVTPIANPAAPFHSLEDVKSYIEQCA